MEDLEDFEYFLETKASKQTRLEKTRNFNLPREPVINICDACFRGIRNMLQKGEEINCNVNFVFVFMTNGQIKLIYQLAKKNCAQKTDTLLFAQ